MKLLVRMMLCLMLSFTLSMVPVVKSAHAGMITTNEAVDIMTRAESHAKVTEFMKRDDVQKQLEKMGINPIDANKRLAGLSDAELRKLAKDMDQAKLGGDVGGILVVVLLVILIIYFAKRI